MKKILAFALVLVLMMSLSVTAFAASSPSKTPSADDFSALWFAPAPRFAPAGKPIDKDDNKLPDAAAKVLSKLTEDQKKELDDAIKTATDAGNVVVASYYFGVDEEYASVFKSRTYNVVVKAGEALYVNGKVVDLSTLKSLGNDKYELVLTGPRTIVIAKAK